MQDAGRLAWALLSERRRRDIHTRDPHHYERQLYRAAAGLLSFLQPVSIETPNYRTSSDQSLQIFIVATRCKQQLDCQSPRVKYRDSMNR